MRQRGEGDWNGLENIVVAECNVDKVVVVFGAICGEFLGGVVFAMYDAVADVFLESGDVLEIVKGLVVEEGLV